MADETPEPWNNGYQLAADVMELLEQLKQGPLDLDHIRRCLLREDELLRCLPPTERIAAQADLLDGLGTFLGSGGVSDAFGAATNRGRSRADRFRAALDWEQLPAELRGLCARRAETVLAQAVTDGLVSSAEPYALTAEGEAFLDRGGYSMK